MVLQLRRIIAAGLALVLSTEAVLADAARAGLWQDRRRARAGPAQSAAFPSALTDVFSAAPAPLASFPEHVLSAAPRLAGRLHDVPEALRRLPASLGEVADARLASRPGAPFVVLIQDAHQVLSAQRSIDGLLSHLKPDVIGVEGSAGPFLIPDYRRLPDQDLQKDIADALFDENLLTGAEHYGLTGEKEAFFWGLEEPALYMENVNAYRRGLAAGREAARVEQAILSAVEEMKAKSFSPAMKEFDALVAGHEARRIPLTAYVEGLAAVPGVALARFPETGAFLRALSLEKALDFAAVERERKALVAALVPALSPAALKDVSAAGLACRAGRIRPSSFYELLRTAAAGAGTDLDRFKAFDAYVRYALAADRVRPALLFGELETLKREAGARLARTPAEKEVFGLQEDLRLAGALLRHELNADRWRLCVSRRRDVLSLPARAGLSAEAAVWPGLLAPFEDFYDAAARRDAVLARNFLARTPEKEAAVGVLIAGGFHAEGLQRALAEGGVSVVTLSPRFQDAPERPSAYLDVFGPTRTPLEKMLLGDRLTTNPQSTTVKVSIDPSLNHALAVCGALMGAANATGGGAVPGLRASVRAEGNAVVAETSSRIAAVRTPAGVSEAAHLSRAAGAGVAAGKTFQLRRRGGRVTVGPLRLSLRRRAVRALKRAPAGVQETMDGAAGTLGLPMGRGAATSGAVVLHVLATPEAPLVAAASVVSGRRAPRWALRALVALSLTVLVHCGGRTELEGIPASRPAPASGGWPGVLIGEGGSVATGGRAATGGVAGSGGLIEGGADGAGAYCGTDGGTLGLMAGTNNHFLPKRELVPSGEDALAVIDRSDRTRRSGNINEGRVLEAEAVDTRNDTVLLLETRRLALYDTSDAQRPTLASPASEVRWGVETIDGASYDVVAAGMDRGRDQVRVLLRYIPEGRPSDPVKEVRLKTYRITDDGALEETASLAIASQASYFHEGPLLTWRGGLVLPEGTREGIRVLDMETGETTAVYAPPSGVTALAVAGNSLSVAASTAEGLGYLLTYDLSAGSSGPVSRLEFPAESLQEAWSVAPADYRGRVRGETRRILFLPGKGGMGVADLTDPAAPVFLSVYRPYEEEGGTLRLDGFDVDRVQGHRLFLTFRTGHLGLSSTGYEFHSVQVDACDPENLTTVPGTLRDYPRDNLLPQARDGDRAVYERIYSIGKAAPGEPVLEDLQVWDIAADRRTGRVRFGAAAHFEDFPVLFTPNGPNVVFLHKGRYIQAPFSYPTDALAPAGAAVRSLNGFLLLDRDGNVLSPVWKLRLPSESEEEARGFEVLESVIAPDGAVDARVRRVTADYAGFEPEVWIHVDAAVTAADAAWWNAPALLSAPGAGPMAAGGWFRRWFGGDDDGRWIDFQAPDREMMAVILTSSLSSLLLWWAVVTWAWPWMAGLGSPVKLLHLFFLTPLVSFLSLGLGNLFFSHVIHGDGRAKGDGSGERVPLTGRQKWALFKKGAGLHMPLIGFPAFVFLLFSNSHGLFWIPLILGFIWQQTVYQRHSAYNRFWRRVTAGDSFTEEELESILLHLDWRIDRSTKALGGSEVGADLLAFREVSRRIGDWGLGWGKWRALAHELRKMGFRNPWDLGRFMVRVDPQDAAERRAIVHKLIGHEAEIARLLGIDHPMASGGESGARPREEVLRRFAGLLAEASSQESDREVVGPERMEKSVVQALKENPSLQSRWKQPGRNMKPWSVRSLTRLPPQDLSGVLRASFENSVPLSRDAADFLWALIRVYEEGEKMEREAPRDALWRLWRGVVGPRAAPKVLEAYYAGAEPLKTVGERLLLPLPEKLLDPMDPLRPPEAERLLTNLTIVGLLTDVPFQALSQEEIRRAQWDLFLGNSGLATPEDLVRAANALRQEPALFLLALGSLAAPWGKEDFDAHFQEILGEAVEALSPIKVAARRNGLRGKMDEVVQLALNSALVAPETALHNPEVAHVEARGAEGDLRLLARVKELAAEEGSEVYMVVNDDFREVLEALRVRPQEAALLASLEGSIREKRLHVVRFEGSAAVKPVDAVARAHGITREQALKKISGDLVVLAANPALVDLDGLESVVRFLLQTLSGHTLEIQDFDGFLDTVKKISEYA
jgi:hypothetical protein